MAKTPESQLPKDRPYKTRPIAVAEKIIADVSTGIYRTPAAALKELVSNAYDADATEVTITTGFPKFEQLVILDNGSGMTLTKFLEVIQHIGGSWKRTENPGGVSGQLGRPLIGRIGIGLLAVAQLGQRFYVSSTVKGQKTRFLAEIDLRPFHKDDAAFRKVGEQQPPKDGKKDEKANDAEVEIGVIKYVDGLPEPANSHFTVITVPDPKQGIVSDLHGQLRDVIGAEAEFTLKAPAPNFKQLCKAVLNAKRADAVLDSYHYLLWELGLLAPVRYLSTTVFDSSQRTIEGVSGVRLGEVEKFQVTVDGQDIRRPIAFPNPAAVRYGGVPPIVYPFKFAQDVAGRPLRLFGYVYAQKPRIDPVELQGVQLRIKNVGIGGYDRTWMGYPFDEGIKFGQVTGEIFVEEGLEAALNIDRASFRETDAHYLAIRAWLWDFLRKTVFPSFKTRQEKFRKAAKAKERTAYEKNFAEALEQAPESVEPKAETGDPGAGPKGKKAQQVVWVADGVVHIHEKCLAVVTSDLGQQARDRLNRVVVSLAAFGVWDSLNAEDALTLLNALAVAVKS